MFGDHFTPANSPSVAENGPYDAIYHVGTIGCVDDPMRMTKQLLSLLKPGGQLLFNAPNAAACWLAEQLWLDAAPPPDVVTLFRAGFWQEQFSSIAEVVEKVETLSGENAFPIGLAKLTGREWHKPSPRQLDASAGDYQNGRNGHSALQKFVERGAFAVGRATGLMRFVPEQPAPFGLFVTMTKK